MPELNLSPTDAPDVDPLDAMLADGAGLTPDKPATPAGEILVLGELVPRHDVESLKDALQCIDKARAPHKAALSHLSMMESQVLEAIRELATGTTKTQRLVGQHGGTLKVELPSDGWDNKKLLDVWESEPEWRGRCLKINEVGVVAKEWKKLLGVVDPPEGLRRFIDKIKAAVKRSLALPKVTIEGPEKGAIDVEPMPETTAELELSQLE